MSDDLVQRLREWLDDDECGDGFRLSGAHDHECAQFQHMRDVRAVLDALAQAERERDIERLKNRGSLAHNLCSDHRDKQDGRRCLACLLEQAKREVAREARRADAMQASAMTNWEKFQQAIVARALLRDIRDQVRLVEHGELEDRLDAALKEQS